MTGRDRVRQGAQWLFWLPLVLVWVVPVGGIAVLLPAAQESQRAELSAATAQTTVVGQQESTYRRAVDITVTLADPVPVKANAAGVVTRVDIEAGDSITEGGVIAAVDTVPVYAWRAGVPLFRDLARGARGPDVKTVADFLVHQKVLDPKLADERFGPGIDRAVRQFQREHGLVVDGVFQRAWLVYVPPEVEVAGSVAVRADARLAVGDTLFSGRGSPTSMQFADAVGAGGEGLRPPAEPLVLLLGEASVPVSGIGLAGDERVRVATALDEAAADGTIAARVEGNTTTYSGPILAAASATTTGSVPGTALYATTGGTACLFATSGGDAATAVPIPAAELGGALGEVSVPVALVGRTVVVDPLTLDPAVLATCG